MAILGIPTLDNPSKVTVSVANVRVEILVITLVDLDFLQLPNALFEFDLLGENALTEGSSLLQLSLLEIQQILEMEPHVSD